MNTLTVLMGTRFGAVEFGELDVLTIQEGLIGFPTLTQFLLLSHGEQSPFQWLQSIDEPGLAFLVVDPATFVPDYTPEIDDAQAEALALSETTPRLLRTTARLIGQPAEELSLNLAAPIVLNLEHRIGKQVVLDNEAYNIRHRVKLNSNAECEARAA
ncbi:MAG: flagellar assembly protein FliW [Methanoregulaceae archaeon]|nr:flagellar assembly protein FliW [Methanoregulaceae archaeon]